MLEGKEAAMASKKHASVEKKNCIACGTCMIVCPTDAIEIKQGYYAQVDFGICVGCAKCAKECPTGCISLVDRGAAAEEERTVE